MNEVQGKSGAVAIDVLWGVGEIATEIRRSTRQTHYLLSTGALVGAKKIGGRWCITRTALRALFGASSTEAA